MSKLAILFLRYWRLLTKTSLTRKLYNGRPARDLQELSRLVAKRNEIENKIKFFGDITSRVLIDETEHNMLESLYEFKSVLRRKNLL